jgi:hypothetical protein
MSIVTVQGNASGTGTLTVTSPNTNSNYTVTLPTATTTLAGTDATQTLTNKTLTSPTMTTPTIDSAQVPTVSGTAPLYMARAWVNFNGTGTVAIRGSGNVSSITDNGTGDYTVNFTTAMSDANYAVTGMCGQGANAMIIHRPTGTALTTSAARVTGASTANALTDMTEVHIAIFR